MMRLFLTHIILFYAFISNGQQPFVSLEVNPKSVEVGTPVEITIKANVDGNLQFDMPDAFTQSGGSHSGMSSSVNFINGQRVVERYNYQKFQGYISEAGTYEIGPVTLNSRNGQLTSDKVTVEVTEKTEMLSENPADNMDNAVFGIIQQSKKEVFVGEPFVVESKVYAQIDIIQVDNYSSFDFKGSSEKVSLDKSTQTTRSFEVVNGIDVMTFNLGKTVFFAESQGTYELSPFEMMVFYDHPRRLFPERLKIQSNASTIRVKPLPLGAPKSFIGAVGKFGLSTKLNKNKTDQGKVVTLSVKVDGTGNLQNIECPKLNLPPGVILYGDPEIEDAIDYNSKGAVGSKTFSFNLQVNDENSITFKPIKISYFDPDSKKYVEITSQPEKLEVIPNESYTPIVTNEESDKEVVNDVSQPFLVSKNTKKPNLNLFNGVSNIILGSPILLSIVFGFFFKYNAEKSKKEQSLIESRFAFEKFQLELTKLKSNSATSEELINLNRTLIQFLSSKLGTNVSSMSKNELKNALSFHEVNPIDVGAMLNFMDYVDQLKFGVGVDDHSKLSDFVNHLENLSKELNIA